VKKIISISLTLILLSTAGYFGYRKYQIYIDNPWTRDGQVRTQVVQVAPRVTGMVTKIYIKDNQKVKKGDILFEIDSARYEVALKQAEANLKRTLEVAKNAKLSYERMQKIYKKDKGAVSEKDLVRSETNYKKSLASIESSQEARNRAKLNLSYCKVYAEIDGYVSNITFQIGTQATANRPLLALVDTSNYWVFGFFREDSIKDIRVGDRAIVTLMAYSDKPLKGRVESIGWGIALTDGNPGNNLLPNIKPVFSWIRLAQRIPVKVKLEKLPKDVTLRFGLTASVLVQKSDTKQ